MADAAAWIGDVAGVAGDDVEMELGDGLAGGGAVVKAEVESVTLKATGSFRLGLGTGRSGC
jgi:hypothetical protein